MTCGVGGRHDSDPALLWLWCRPAAVAPIWPLAWEPPYATGVGLKRKKRHILGWHIWLPFHIYLFPFYFPPPLLYYNPQNRDFVFFCLVHKDIFTAYPLQYMEYSRKVLFLQIIWECGVWSHYPISNPPSTASVISATSLMCRGWVTRTLGINCERTLVQEITIIQK